MEKKYGTKAESVRQGNVIKALAKKDPKIAAEWQRALKGKTTIESVFKKATRIKKPSIKGKKKSVTLIQDTFTEQKHILTEKISNLSQVNQLIKGKYDRLVQTLKKLVTDIKNADGDIENKFKHLIEKLGNLIDEINNPQKQKLFFTPPEELRKAELKIN